MCYYIFFKDILYLDLFKIIKHLLLEVYLLKKIYNDIMIGILESLIVLKYNNQIILKQLHEIFTFIYLDVYLSFLDLRKQQLIIKEW